MPILISYSLSKDFLIKNDQWNIKRSIVQKGLKWFFLLHVNARIVACRSHAMFYLSTSSPNRRKKIAEILLTFTIKTFSTIYFMKIQGHSLASFLYIFVYIYILYIYNIPKWKICQFLVTSKGFKEIIDSGNIFIES